MALVGTLALMMAVVLVGKSFKQIRPLAYVIVIAIALLQVAIVLYAMFTMPFPIG